MLRRFYPYRFEIFFITQLSILFGSIIIPVVLFENEFSPIIFLANLISGLILIQMKRILFWTGVGLLLTASLIYITRVVGLAESELDYLRLAVFFVYYVLVSYEIISQVWNAKKIGKNVIFGLISGYISLGLIGFFICMSIEMTDPGSFVGGLIHANSPELISSELMYYSYITLLTIGYGDILPVTVIAQKAAVLIGLLGQFYLVIITSVIVGKYLNQMNTPQIDSE